MGLEIQVKELIQELDPDYYRCKQCKQYKLEKDIKKNAIVVNGVLQRIDFICQQCVDDNFELETEWRPKK